MTIRTFLHSPTPPSIGSLADVQVYLRRLWDTMFRMRQGKIECVTEVTLAASVATTTFNDIRISIQTCLIFDPRTANAAAELKSGNMYVLDANRSKGQIVISHTNNAQVDRTFFLALLG